MTSSKVLKEPLLHFFVLGAGLFVLFASLNREAMESPDEVAVDRARVESLAAQFERTWQRAPTAEELRGLIDGWVREEILYREGVALGLDINDTIVRRRIAQKMEFIADGSVPGEPTDAQLEEWLQSNMDVYRIEPVYSFQQVYFDPSRHGADLRLRLSTLEKATAPPEGDPTLLPGSLASARASEVERTFGSTFAAAIAELPIAEWGGPVESAYGLHMVKVDAKSPAREPTLAEARTAVERDWSAKQAEELNEAFYRAVRKRYTVRLPTEAATAGGAAAASGR